MKYKLSTGGMLSSLSRLVPRVEAAGLLVADGLVEYQNLNGGRNEHVALRLPPGIVSGGKVQNPELLINTLLELRRRMSLRSRKSGGIVLTVPITDVYVQPFTLPAVTSGALHESAQLNMKMICPMEIEKTYYGWQQIGNENSDQVEMLGAFAPRDVIDSFISCVQEAGYTVAAVEFSTLSLIRAALKAGAVDKESPSLLLEVAPEGLNFSVSHAGCLFFHRFAAWGLFGDGGKNIETEKFEEGFVDEVRKVVNFYSTGRQGGEIKKMVLVSPTFTERITQIVGLHFPGVEIKVADPGQVGPAMGAALRGLTPRSRDNEITLTTLNAVETFGKHQLANFLAVWRDILLTTFAFVLLVFLVSDLVLQRVAVRVSAENPFAGNAAGDAELAALEAQVRAFNTLVSVVKNAVSDKKELSGLLRKLNGLTGASIRLIRINVDTAHSSVLIEGVAQSRDAITTFRKTLEGQPQFNRVNLALSDIRTQPDGTEIFSLSLGVKDFNF